MTFGEAHNAMQSWAQAMLDAPFALVPIVDREMRERGGVVITLRDTEDIPNRRLVVEKVDEDCCTFSEMSGYVVVNTATVTGQVMIGRFIICYIGEWVDVRPLDPWR